MRPMADAVSGFIFFTVPVAGADLPLIVVWLICAGVFFTFYLRLVNIRGFKHAVDLVRGKHKVPGDPGEISQFQALTTAVSGTVGIGNIAGVAVAISLGGPGATLWLIVAGFLGMSTKLAECTLAVMYRRERDGQVSGGPMHYLERGLAARNWLGMGRRVGRALGLFYAAAMVIGCLGIGNMFQSNQATAILIDVTGGANSVFADRAWLVGLLLAAGVGLVIIGGIRTIANTTAKLVPAMAILYVLSALTIIALNAEALPGAIAAIWNGAFSPQGVAGGALGVMILGFRRAVFSNEAGLGSAAIAHAAARTKEPVSEGFVALLEPFIDTVVICTLTALVIITTVYDPALAGSGVSGIELTTRAFASTLSWSPIPLSIAAILFAYSTMLAWSYYGLKAFTYLVGERRGADLGFKLFFLTFVVLGSSIQLGALVDLSDALVFVVAIPNLLGLYLMAPLIRRELIGYERRMQRATRP
ncbi:MAG: alanine:cation symporter family protein [Gammaproteobacteria bacterium]|nr:alanine:cation symporter family protein [Gammaproteobacteria bacterium]MYG11952.1 alanine:cation symporter family protein [Gammaproteobacteria bacterium]